jgi:UDP-N-acetyl-D-glucosamine dehydrogenase
LEQRGARITYTDPYLPRIQLGDRRLTSEDALRMSTEADCVVVVTDHAKFDYPGILDAASLIVDARNAYKSQVSDKIVRL